MTRCSFHFLFIASAACVGLVAPSAQAVTGVYVSVTVTQAATQKGRAVPAEGALVTLVAPNGRLFHGVSDQNGKVLFDDLPRKWRPVDYDVVVHYAGQVQTGVGHHVPFKFVVK